MTICARILHPYVEDCPCDDEDRLVFEGFQLAVLEQLNEIIPGIPGSSTQVPHDRVRYLFEQLKCFLQTTGLSVEKVARSLKTGGQAKRAAECMIQALDVTSGNHAVAVGIWAWESLLLPLSKPRVTNLHASFIGWPGNS